MSTRDVEILAQYDDETSALRARATDLKAEIRRLALSAEASAYTERAALREELDALPALLGDVARRRALAHLEWLTARAAEATAELAELEAKADVLKEEIHQHTKKAKMAFQLRKDAEHTAEIRAAIALDADYRRLIVQVEAAKRDLMYCYSVARVRYAVRLDDSPFEVWLDKPWVARTPLAAPGAWEHVGEREAVTVETAMRGEFGSAFA